MKKLSIVLIAMAMIALPLAAQEHHAGKKVKDEITLGAKVIVSGQTLEPGKYVIECDHKDLVFIRASDGKKIAFPCNGREMSKNADTTELYTVDKNGVRVATRLLLKGSPVDHAL